MRLRLNTDYTLASFLRRGQKGSKVYSILQITQTVWHMQFNLPACLFSFTYGPIVIYA